MTTVSQAGMSPRPGNGLPHKAQAERGIFRGIPWDFSKYGGLCPGTPQGEGQ